MKRLWSWLLWWNIDATELDAQVANYEDVALLKSPRGLSILCILFSITITVVLLITKIVTDRFAYVDVGIFAVLGSFIYFGHRWAMIVVMIHWTFERGYLVFLGLNGTIAPTVVTQIIWWCIYMHAFYFAFRVEQQRRRRTVAEAVG
jgi:hypothetical protein